eukprot:PhF_6_TR6107/c0_g1_i3/m.8994
MGRNRQIHRPTILQRSRKSPKTSVPVDRMLRQPCPSQPNRGSSPWRDLCHTEHCQRRSAIGLECPVVFAVLCGLLGGETCHRMWTLLVRPCAGIVGRNPNRAC